MVNSTLSKVHWSGWMPDDLSYLDEEVKRRFAEYEAKHKAKAKQPKAQVEKEEKPLNTTSHRTLDL